MLGLHSWRVFWSLGHKNKCYTSFMQQITCSYFHHLFILKGFQNMASLGFHFSPSIWNPPCFPKPFGVAVLPHRWIRKCPRWRSSTSKSNDHRPMGKHHSSMICGVFFIDLSKYEINTKHIIPKMWLYVWRYHTQYTKRWCMTYKYRVMNHELRSALGVLITCCIQQQDMSDVFIKSLQVE